MGIAALFMHKKNIYTQQGNQEIGHNGVTKHR